MNKVLNDLKQAINNIPKFYYSSSDVEIRNGNLFQRSEKIKNYERRFVSQLKSEYDKIINDDKSTIYNDVNTDFEIVKKYVYYQDQLDELIRQTYFEIEKSNDKAFDSITTIPDFFIHKSQNNIERKHQLLAVEVKTSKNLTQNDFCLDFFKLHVYAEKYNFQNAVFLVTNNSIDKIKSMVNYYSNIKNWYTSPNNSNNVSILIKEKFGAAIFAI